MSDRGPTCPAARALVVLATLAGSFALGASSSASASRLIVDGGVIQVWTLPGPDLPPCDATHPGQGSDRRCLPPCDPDHPGTGAPPPTCPPPCDPPVAKGKPAPCRDVRPDDHADQDVDAVTEDTDTAPDGAFDMHEATGAEVAEPNPVVEPSASQPGTSVEDDDDPPTAQ